MWFQRSDFRKLADIYFRRLDKAWKTVEFPAAEGPEFVVLLTPWGRTAAPFFSMETALMLRLLGARVTVICDTTNLLSNAANAEEVKLLQDLAAKLAAFPVSVEAMVSSGSANGPAPASLDAVVFENVVKQERSEAGARSYLDAHKELTAAYRGHAARVSAVLGNHGGATLILPGGIWGVSGVYSSVAGTLGMTYWTYDSGHKFLAYARNGCAAHYPDFADAFTQAIAAVKRNPDVQTRIVDSVRERLALRRAGGDEYRVQLQSEGESRSVQCDVLILLNYRLDTAAMAQNVAFADVTTWLRSVLEWLAANTSARVIVRQHPCERLPDFRSAEDYRWVERIAPDRIRFVSCEEPLNTYDALETCKVVLPHTSRSGLEAAVFGKPTIVCSKAYYRDCPFIHAASTPSEYFEMISSALNAGTDAGDLAAKSVAYYLADFCVLNPTTFTPIQSDFKAWARRAPAELLSDKEVRSFFRVLLSGENPILSAFDSRFPGLLSPVPTT